jgi:hypothetical protein
MTNEVPLRRRTPMETARYAGDKMTELQDQINLLSALRREAVRELAATMTYREIGAELDISSPRVSQIVGKRWRKPRSQQKEAS